MGIKCAVKFSKKINYIPENDAKRIINHIDSLKNKKIK